MDAILTHVYQHETAAIYADHLLPFDTFLLAMLLEEHKEVEMVEMGIDDLD